MKTMLKTLLSTGIAIAISTSLAFSADIEKMSWDKIVTQAKEEGELTWYVWYLRDELRDAAKSFEEEYGIQVTIPEGTSGGNQDKLLAERERETGDIDVFAVSYNTARDWEMGNMFTKINHILPDTNGRTQDLTGILGHGYLFAYWGNQTGIAYDPDQVDQSVLPQTPKDFAAFWASNPGKFGFNYEKGGSGPSFFHNTIRVLSDIDYFGKGDVDVKEKLAGIKPGLEFFNKNAENYVITSSNADSITRVSDRELWMVPAWEDHLAGLQNRGEVRKKINFYIPAMGMSGGGNGVAIPKNAPHPAAALLFINWLTSAETQTTFNTRFGTAPMHADADDTNSLVPNEQRIYRQPWASNPFYQNVTDTFIEEVVLNR